MNIVFSIQLCYFLFTYQKRFLTYIEAKMCQTVQTTQMLTRSVFHM